MNKKNKKFNNNMNSTENKKTNDEAVVTKEEQNVAQDEATLDQKAKDDAAEELSDKEKLSQELTDAQKKIEDQHDKYLRLSAEFDNYRKRTMKEKAEIIKNGAEKTITSILPILDDFERALQNIQPSEETKALYEGVDLIYNKFLKTLTQEGLNKIDTDNQPFDTDYHEAIALVPTPEEDKKGKILDCVQPGYKLNDKVIRHAKVVVGQ